MERSLPLSRLVRLLGRIPKGFLPFHFEAITFNALETTAYYQGKRSIGEYLDEFLNLVEDSRCTDPQTVVVKFC